MEKVISLAFLYLFAKEDYAERQLSERWLWIFAVIGAWIKWYQDGLFSERFWVNYLPGIFLLLLGWLSSEKIGYGDGIVVLLMGLYLELHQLFPAVILGFLLAACFGIITIWKKNREEKWKVEVPYIPFFLAGTVVVFGVT